MAALCQDHRAGPRRVSPVSADVAVCEVPVGDVLPPIDRDDFPKTTRRDDLTERDKEGRVTQDVRDLEQPLLRLGRGGDLEALPRCRRDRLLEQHVVPGREQCERARPVTQFEGRVDQRGREGRPGRDVLP